MGGHREGKEIVSTGIEQLRTAGGSVEKMIKTNGRGN